MRAERDVLTQAQHPAVVKLAYSFQDELNLYLVMEYMAGGDLMGLLIKEDIFSERKTKRFAAQAILAVQDRGPGIPAGRLEEVFNRFYSERPAGEAFGEHSGLGLSIARQIARGYGGDLTAANDEGACFTLTLPLTAD